MKVRGTNLRVFGKRVGPGTQSQGRGPIATCMRGEKRVTCAGGILVLGGPWTLGEAGRAPACLVASEESCGHSRASLMGQ